MLTTFGEDRVDPYGWGESAEEKIQKALNVKAAAKAKMAAAKAASSTGARHFKVGRLSGQKGTMKMTHAAGIVTGAAQRTGKKVAKPITVGGVAGIAGGTGIVAYDRKKSTQPKGKFYS